MKRTPQSAKAYAEYLYMAAKCTGEYCGTYTDTAIVNARVRAFVDGANWQKRRARKAKQRSASGDSNG